MRNDPDQPTPAVSSPPAESQPTSSVRGGAPNRPNAQGDRAHEAGQAPESAERTAAR
ncbi:MAG: hypothetical protein AVDCRST_MAG40-1902, partial [uncultured Gemmatimonadaceae bacterium]